MSETSGIHNIGFIGLGVMGKPMARNLLRAGYKLMVKSRSPGPVEELVAEGAKTADSPSEVARASEVVITMLPNSPEVKEVCVGPDGIIDCVTGDYRSRHSRTRPITEDWDSGIRQPAAHSRARVTVIDMSTISPAASREIGQKLWRAGIDYIEAPVSGGDIGAINATLSIMAGGPQSVFDWVLPVLQKLGKSVVRIGEWGSGQSTKLANNIICATTIEAVSEALVFAVRAGVDPERMYEAIRGGAAACWSLDHKVPKIVERDFRPGFMVKLHLKDLDLALESAREMGIRLPITEQVREMLKQLHDAGHGNDDNCSLVKIIEKMAGIEVRAKPSVESELSSS